MKGDDRIIETLNSLLAAELAARDQYFIHSRMYDDWGLGKLHERLNHEMEEETEHASRLIERILFLEGTPNMEGNLPLKVGKDVPGMLGNDLEMEMHVVSALREAITACESASDYQTREILEALLADTEEDHTWWLEKQLGLIEKVGLKNYLQSQMS